MSSPPRRVRLNPAQIEFLSSTSHETMMLCGIGAGKTVALAAALLRAQAHGTGTMLGLYAPTIRQMHAATLPQVLAAWTSWGLENGVHYVFNRIPPKGWPEPTRLASYHGLISFQTGARCRIGGLENFNSIRGDELDEAFVDEFRDISPAAREVLVGRLRGKLYKALGKPARIWYATSPPDDPTYVRGMIESDGLRVVRAPSHVNAANLPAGYLDGLRRIYDEETYRREVLGELVVVSGRPFAHAFSADRHVAPVALDPAYPLYLSLDFNVDPIVGIVCQAQPGAFVRVLKEYRLRHSDIYALISAVRADYPPERYQMMVTGDASGHSRNAALASGMTMWRIVRDLLGLPSSSIKVDRSNPPLAHSRNVLNSALHTLRVQIDPSCTWLIADLQLVQVTDAGGVDKSKDARRTHLLDAFRYLVHHIHAPDFERAARRT